MLVKEGPTQQQLISGERNCVIYAQWTARYLSLREDVICCLLQFGCNWSNSCKVSQKEKDKHQVISLICREKEELENS